MAPKFSWRRRGVATTPGNSPPLPDIGRDLRVRSDRHELSELAIRRVHRLGKVGRRRQVGFGLPLAEQIDIAVEPRLCFT